MLETITIEKDKCLEFLIKQSGISGSVSAELLGNRQMLERATVLVTKIADHPINDADGEISVRIGKRHLKLKKLLFRVATSLFFLGVSVAISSGEVALAAGEKGLEAVHSLLDLLAKMDDTEIYVYDIIVDIAKNNRIPSISPEHKRGTKKDISGTITERGEMVPKSFDAVIEKLLIKGAIKPFHPEGADTIYEPVT